MHIICNQKLLSQKINICQKAISNKSNNEILKGALLIAKNNQLKLIGYDLEIAIEAKLNSVEIIREGEIVINSKLFGEIIRKLPNTLIEIEVKDNIVSIKYNDSKFEIKGENAKEYPQLPQLENKKKYLISQELLKSMIKQTVFAISTDTTKPVLTGELLELSENKISLVAIDGYRLAVKSCTVDNNLDYNKTIIPGKSLNDINSILTGLEDVSVEFNEKHAIFNLEDIRIITRVLDGEFIDYKKLLPKEYNTKIKVNNKEFLESIERASLLSQSDKNNLIKLSIKENKILITSNSDKGNICESIEMKLEGDSLDIAFNSRYLIDGLKNIESEYIYMEFTSNINPCIIRPVDDTDYIYLLLPVRISSNS